MILSLASEGEHEKHDAHEGAGDERDSHTNGCHLEGEGL
jgi:hypothetical protein